MAVEQLNGVIGDGMQTLQHTMKFRVVLMSPRVASELLKHRHPNQRKPKNSRIELYAAEIVNDYWILTHQAVAVDVDGWLIDGQNRCEAIVKANKAAPILLITGVPKNAMLATDNGLSRNVTDAARVAGCELPHGANSFAAAAKRMMIGNKSQCRGFSNQEVLAFIDVHRKALEFTFECMPNPERFLTSASVRAVMARAYYRRPVLETRDRIAEFGEVFLTGLMGNTKTDAAAIRLRNWLTKEFSGRRGVGVRPHAQTVYAKASTAMDHFLNHDNIESLYVSSKELFPLPGVNDDDESDGGG